LEIVMEDALFSGFTVTETEAVFPPQEAVIVVFPDFFAVTMPDAETDATEGSALVQRMACVQDAGRTRQSMP
jgi:hypothetical protein